MKKLFFIAFLLIGCANAEIKRLPEPDNLIPEDKMVLIIKDLTVMESYIQMKTPEIDKNYKVMNKNGEAILKKYNVDTLSFENSIDYYGSRQERMQWIYSKALDLINRELAKEQAKK